MNENKNRPKGKTTKIKGTFRVYYLTKGLKLLKEKKWETKLNTGKCYI